MLKENDADYFNEFTIDDDLDAEMPVPAPAPPRKSVVPEDADEGADDNEQLEVPADDNGDSRQAAGDEAAKLNGAGAEAEAAAEEDAPAHSSPVQPPAADRTADKAAPSQLASPATPSATVCQTEDLVVDTLEPAGNQGLVGQAQPGSINATPASKYACYYRLSAN